ncbi:hypothetical protein DPMN_105357 [Dreissena polymorpha]|uniref:HECT-type E3 ubiquitin transferase n=1 Tax=Dreissena polymorpha TaxID=45954 RepID=A0A9D4HD67_DREPO|nr:hypothetical protein DPMN_105357 [Dreissena polymorpha]
MDEAGIDRGEIFREFLFELLKTGFDPNRGFFSQTTDRLFSPNHQSALLLDNFEHHYFFLGTSSYYSFQSLRWTRCLSS